MLAAVALDNARMRINLVTPFAEKDRVKALGARWDAAKKCWYIVDVADTSPFSRWIPTMEATAEVRHRAVVVTKSKVSLPTPANAIANEADNVMDCSCDVLPWDDCIHTAKK